MRALESLSDKYDREKRDLIMRLEKEKEEILKKEEQKYESRIRDIKQVNTQINQKLTTLQGTEEDFQILQKNYNEAI